MHPINTEMKHNLLIKVKNGQLASHKNVFDQQSKNKGNIQVVQFHKLLPLLLIV